MPGNGTIPLPPDFFCEECGMPLLEAKLIDGRYKTCCPGCGDVRDGFSRQSESVIVAANYHRRVNEGIAPRHIDFESGRVDRDEAQSTQLPEGTVAGTLELLFRWERIDSFLLALARPFKPGTEQGWSRPLIERHRCILSKARKFLKGAGLPIIIDSSTKFIRAVFDPTQVSSNISVAVAKVQQYAHAPHEEFVDACEQALQNDPDCRPATLGLIRIWDSQRSQLPPSALQRLQLSLARGVLSYAAASRRLIGISALDPVAHRARRTAKTLLQRHLWQWRRLRSDRGAIGDSQVGDFLNDMILVASAPTEQTMRQSMASESFTRVAQRLASTRGLPHKWLDELRPLMLRSLMTAGWLPPAQVTLAGFEVSLLKFFSRRIEWPVIAHYLPKRRSRRKSFCGDENPHDRPNFRRGSHRNFDDD